MLKVILTRVKRGCLLLILILVAILIFNSISLLIMPHYKEVGQEVIERLREPSRLALAGTVQRERHGFRVAINQNKSHLFTGSDELASPGIRDIIWSNESVPILSPKDACSLHANASLPEILVMVLSGVANFERRDAIRNSWADAPLIKDGKIKVIFVLGQKLSEGGASEVLQLTISQYQ